MAGYYGGGVTAGFGEGWSEGSSIVANTATFGQVSSLNTYANSLQGGVYDWSRGFATVGVGSAYLATGGALVEASPALYVGAVNASANPWTTLPQVERFQGAPRSAGSKCRGRGRFHCARRWFD